MNIFIPFAPVAKARARTVGISTGTPHTYTPKKTEEYEEELRWLFKSQCRSPFTKGIPLKVEITFFLPKPKRCKNQWPVTRPDLDNYVKAVFDAANGILWHDDSLCADKEKQM